ncbi:MAG TPA: pantoate--beta-alanine ligase [Thermotogaceae bacterium]|nr:pantoate--beta-alanine ligase [Thermotogota bacterium]HEW91689.1 pantoate--beta-alanine ligase [Thermotogaceae bacterium]
MRLIQSIKEMKNVSNDLIKMGKSIGFVPTMGYLHEGHLSLVRKARKENDVVVVSIFVNPTQFGPNEDFNRYPRDLERDLKLLEDEGVEFVFNPIVEEMYPSGYATYVIVERLTEVLCGRSRPGHFKGVATIVTKLFNIVKPTRAYFGQKDAQQFRVLKRMVEDLNMDVEMIEVPIVRENDGLAMSSRNVYLSPEERKQALSLYESLNLAKQAIKNGERDVEKIKEIMKKNFARYDKVIVDYIEIVDEKELTPLSKVDGKILIAVAAFVGKARLIDNIIMEV